MSNKRTHAQISEHRIRHAFEFASGATRLAIGACSVARARLFGDFEAQFHTSLRLHQYHGDLAELSEQVKPWRL
jgi:hypothetical protein